MSTKLRDSMGLKILILSDGRAARLGAGNWVQARETAEAMQFLGFDATHMIYEVDRGHVPCGLAVVKEDFDYAKFDIVHFIPVSPETDKVIKKNFNLQRNTLFVASTIFWDSKIHREVCARNSGQKYWLIRYWLRKFLPYLSRSWNRFQLFDVLLPNSDMEIPVLQKTHSLKKGASTIAVPNALGKIPAWVSDLEPLKSLQGKDYILYPGVFSPRKNQLGFIRALKNTDYKIVFMGGPLGTEDSDEYYVRCKKEAGSNCVFLGSVKHWSKKFFQVMKYAKVACLASSCETPGIALLEASALGVRVAVTREGCAREYFGFEAEYFNPLCDKEIQKAIQAAWRRGALSDLAKSNIETNFSWETVAKRTVVAYEQAFRSKSESKN